MFTFKQFEVDDSRCGMKVGTDSVLLGSWTPVVTAVARPRVLDIGAGSGLLSLMMAQRMPLARVDAVEIDAEAAAQARENVDRSPWGDRIDVITGDILEIADSVKQPYDLVISNPPFFSEALRAPDCRRSLARHGSGFDVITLLKVAPRLMARRGVLAFVAPVSRDAEIKFEATMARLEPLASCDIRQRGNRPVVRRLYLFGHSGGCTPLPDLPHRITITGDDNRPTASYRALTRDFYLFS